MKEKNNLTLSANRKARTRTLIQLGGLIEKSGLMDEFDIEPGDDLQKDLEKKDHVFALLGALLETKSMLHNEEFHKDLLMQKGAKAFQEDKKNERENEEELD
ncbi:MAG: conjugal transfer protein TraD [Simkaniaceae bacterium]|nr:conjugal transfer protein TraD [Simkaniaceae bacterium]